MSLVEKIAKIKRNRHDGNYAWGHTDAVKEAAALALEADETIADLLAALKLMLDGYSECEKHPTGTLDGFVFTGALTKARAAISKAEGAAE